VIQPAEIASGAGTSLSGLVRNFMEERRTEVIVNWLPVAEVEPHDGKP